MGIAFVVSGNMHAKDYSASGLDAISRAAVINFASRNVSKIDVLQIDPSAFVRAAVSSSMLETSFDYRMTVSNFQNTVYASQLKTALSNLGAYPSQKKSDLRWGAIFYDQTGSRIGGLFLASDGKSGAINDVNVVFTNGPDVVQWLGNTLFKATNEDMGCEWMRTLNSGD